MKPEDCSKAVLAYWISPSTPYSVIDITGDPLTAESTAGSRIKHKQLELSHTLGRAYVNGIELRVIFDTGAETSMLSVKTAARAGIKTDSPGVVAAGVSHGIGKDLVATYIAPVSSFKIGDEEIKNTRLEIGDIDLEVADMLLGADFFLSHRIYVANSQHKLYFTYNGGPVFNLTTAKEAAAAAAAQPPGKEAGPPRD
jgi:Aspartyl protease